MKLVNIIIKLNLCALLLGSSMVYALDQQTTTKHNLTTPADKGKLVTADDAKINDSIRNLIANSATLSNLNINVTTLNRVVTLTGTVASDSQASSLIELAQSVVGVKDVEARHLTVQQSQQPFQDMLITAKIKGLFIREDVFGTKDIASINLSVETKNGIVYLTGFIDNKKQIANAIKLIEGIKGVKKVEYNVKKEVSSIQ